MSVNQQNGQLFSILQNSQSKYCGELFEHLVKPFILNLNLNGEPLSDIDVEFTNPAWLPPFHCLQVQPINKYIKLNEHKYIKLNEINKYIFYAELQNVTDPADISV